MPKKILFSVVFCLLAVFSVHSDLKGNDVQSPLPKVKRVVLIGADGFGAHYVKWDDLSNLKMMKENGAWTLHMRCVMPSVSAINWATILMGAPSEMHGFREWGSKKPDIQSIFLTKKGLFPCIFSVLRDQVPQAKSSAVYDWDGIGNLYQKADVNEQKCIAFGLSKDDPKAAKMTAEEKDLYLSKLKTEAVTEQALKFLTKDKTLCFIYFGEPDHVGHKLNWGSQKYQESMIHVDKQVGKILAHLKKNGMDQDTIVIFIADHGGTEKGHGKGIMEHMEVPWILYGPGVKKGNLNDVIVNYDNTATIAWILGLKQPQAWRGQAITSAFDVK
ncbi:MAG: alkaline phosphatase [Planctomycetia bacterium]|nr:alkaline phosphatase [Planctomycetia bacterium]